LVSVIRENVGKVVPEFLVGYCIFVPEVEMKRYIKRNRVKYFGGKEWRVHGELHREDGPAVIFPSGHSQWWINNKRHRIDGPAIEYHDGTFEFWVDGIQLNNEIITKWMKENNITYPFSYEESIFFQLTFLV